MDPADKQSLHRWIPLLRAFRGDRRGQIAILFALSSLAIFAGLAASVDLATAYLARQRLSQVATLACQYSTRMGVAQTATATSSGTNGFQTYVAAVNSFVTSNLASQHWSGATPTGGTATPTSYFTATQATGGTSAAANVPSNPVVELNATVPTIFGKIVNVSSINVHAKIACQTLDTTPQIVNPPTILKEGFETGCQGYCFKNPSGGSTTIGSPANTFPGAVGYTGYNGFKWYIMGYCLETDKVGVINSAVPEGSVAAELDCDNGSGSAGNSSISSLVPMQAGQYELRYFYRSRVDYPDYDPAYICGSTASDVSWANAVSRNWIWSVSKTNQINVYLDANIAGTNGTVGSPALHKTSDNVQYLAGSNLIDSCVYSPTWVERSVKIKITNPGSYWLTFAADGNSDSYGGQIDSIRLCQELCTGSLQDNFPSTWLAANNGGVNKILFEDTFDSPAYTADTSPSHFIAKGGNPNASTGTSGTASSGWPSQTASGWAAAPYNQATYAEKGAYQGSQYLTLDGSNIFSSGSASKNRLISRPFLLDPGYYQISYNYIAMVDFSPAGVYGTFCTAAPGLGYNFAYPAIGASMLSGYIRYYQSTTADATTNIITLFMSSGQLVSTPIASSTLGATTSFTNPDGTTSTTPTVQPDAVSWANSSYNPAISNPILDTCGYADSFRWIPRSVSVKITKPGQYWLSFSANGGAADGNGGGIDDVKLTALGSPYMSSPPTSPLVAIPVPAPQPDASYTPGTYPGFTIVADPFQPPGADQ